MPKLQLKQGTTSKTVLVFVRDNSMTTGAGLTGLAFNTSSLTAYYAQPGASATAITLATQTATGAYSSGGFCAVDGTNMPGLYRLDIPNTALTGAPSVVLMLKGATNMEPCVLEIELTAWDNQDATAGGLSRLDAAISSRSTYAGADTSGTTTLLSRLTSTRAGYLDNLATAPAIAGDAMALTTSERNSVADAILKRDWTAVTGEASRSLLNALRFLRNKRAVSGSTLTVTKEDDSTSAWTATLTTDDTALPITGVDPS